MGGRGQGGSLFVYGIAIYKIRGKRGVYQLMAVCRVGIKIAHKGLWELKAGLKGINIVMYSYI